MLTDFQQRLKNEYKQSTEELRIQQYETCVKWDNFSSRRTAEGVYK
jgi:hypothetical protein